MSTLRSFAACLLLLPLLSASGGDVEPLTKEQKAMEQADYTRLYNSLGLASVIMAIIILPQIYFQQFEVPVCVRCVAFVPLAPAAAVSVACLIFCALRSCQR